MRIGQGIVAGALALAMAAPALADDALKTTARATATKTSKAVVSVKLVLKLKVGGARGARESEQKLEVVGTVIDPSGLTMVSASAVDPAALVGGGAGRRGRGDGESAAPSIETEVGETMIVLEDGTEIEADVVLKDADLDLAFIRPREAQKLDAVELKPRGKAPELLEDIFAVTRLGRNEGRATAVAVGAVKAVVKGPKTYYICTPEVANGSVGCVAYAANGAPLGVFVLKSSAGEGGGARGGRFAGGGGRDVSTVLRPIEDILDVVKQAKEAKAPERKAAPAPEPAAGGTPTPAPEAPTPPAGAPPAAPPSGQPR